MLTISSLYFCLYLGGCQNKQFSSEEYEKSILSSKGLIRDPLYDSLIRNALKSIEPLTQGSIQKRIVFAKDYNKDDTSQILVIPFVTSTSSYASEAYSDIEDRFILIQPSAILKFVQENALTDSTSYNGIMGFILLHEAGHFILRKTGAFDVVTKQTQKLGEESMQETQPQHLTKIKKIELAADSIAASLIKKGLTLSNVDCSSMCMDIERIIPGMQFTIFGKRMIDRFGDPNIKILYDPSNSHPNLELRVAFINYYLFPTEQRKNDIDEYLYQREVVTVHNQENDPRIYQGQEKKLN